jgi:hypothetical protein
MDTSILFFPFFCGFLFFVVLFFYLIVVRFLDYREAVKLAEKGLVRPAAARDANGAGTLRWGIAIAAIGLALTLGLWPIGFYGGTAVYPLGVGPWMLVGFIPLFFGLGLVLVYLISREPKKPETGEPPADKI